MPSGIYVALEGEPAAVGTFNPYPVQSIGAGEADVLFLYTVLNGFKRKNNQLLLLLIFAHPNIVIEPLLISRSNPSTNIECAKLTYRITPPLSGVNNGFASTKSMVRHRKRAVDLQSRA